MTNNCKAYIEGVTGKPPHPHQWLYLIKDKRQCLFCNKTQFHDDGGWHFKFTDEEDDKE